MKPSICLSILVSVLLVQAQEKEFHSFQEVYNNSPVPLQVLQYKESDTLNLIYNESLLMRRGTLDNVSSECISITFTIASFLRLERESLLGLKARSLYINNAIVDIQKGFISPGSLKSLILDNCGTPETLLTVPKIFPDLEELHFYSNNLPVIPSKTFVSMKNLKRLSLVLSNIVTLELGCFSGLNDLLVLNLSYNRFTSLPSGVFDGFSKLKHLYVDNCHDLKQIDVNAFRGMDSLGELWLQNNSIDSLQVGLFDDLRSLAALSLESTNITHIPKGVFDKVKTLRVIYLKNNRITSIEPNAFAVLNLESLELSGGLSQDALAPGVFNGLTVEDLHLRGNDIREIKPNVWDGLFAENVNLSSNNLTKISVEYFAGLNTTTLYLLANGITEIAQNAFKNTHVKEIDLRNNTIKTVEKTTWGLPESVKITIE